MTLNAARPPMPERCDSSNASYGGGWQPREKDRLFLRVIQAPLCRLRSLQNGFEKVALNSSPLDAIAESGEQLHLEEV